MLDALSALGLASSVVQIIDFTSRLVAEGCELYKAGKLGKHDELEQVTKDLAFLAEGLTITLPLPTNPSLPAKHFSKDEEALQQLALSCKALADELLGILADLIPAKPRNGLESFRTALRSKMKMGKIKDVEQRLEKL